MDLEQHVHAVRKRGILDIPGRGIIERRHDDQDAVGAMSAGLDHLIGVVHEILAQHRQRRGGARGDHEVEMALERRRVGQHRQARRAAGLIGPRQRRRIEIGADQAFRRRGLLHFRDQRVVAAREFFADRADKTARRRRRLRQRFDAGKRMRALGGGDLLALVGFDLGQDVGHSDPAFSRWRPRSDASGAPRRRRCRATWCRARRLPSNPWPCRRRSVPPPR